MIAHNIEYVSLLLLIAAVVAMLARRAHLPYTVGLLVTGVGLALLRSAPAIHLTKDLIFNAFLPPLIFEAAFYLPWRALRRDFLIVVVLATAGVLLSTGVTALGMHAGAGWAWTTALLFGVLISATDPVSVIATFKETPVPERLKILVEAESLFNDGTAAVAFTVALAAVQGAGMTGWGITLAFCVTVLGGAACGAVVAGAMLLLERGTDDHMVELTLTTVAAYGSFLLAEHFHLSGVLATLTAGLIVGNVCSFTQEGRESITRFWDYMAFLANSLIFLLIGQSLASLNVHPLLRTVLIAVAVVLLGRALSVYLCSALFRRTRRPIEMRHQHVLFWGGLRGALALALVLGLPQDIPQRPLLITVVFAVVAFSIIVQGLTMKPLLRKLNLLVSEHALEGQPNDAANLPAH
ncbi:sodium/hydrogen exchanger [Capsulimonas corticalis]|uniref:Sodium/hydrogen exchanger n=1 Tax=Capsulimonas corticalis TaxID=2219043 RepID=A0A402CW75_9BACT|nr:sodium:proton antiporter [Capsulimonas corticalis]BDI34070.1 sodium/hydrogen exchanger [Capsulimonas corticalis]